MRRVWYHGPLRKQYLTIGVAFYRSSVFLSTGTVEYLRRNSNNQSMDATVLRLLNLDKNKGKLVKRQVGRTQLAPIEAYTWTIIHQLYMASEGTLSRRALQVQVHEFLRAGGYLRPIQTMMPPQRMSNHGGSSGTTVQSLTSGRMVVWSLNQRLGQRDIKD